MPKEKKIRAPSLTSKQVRHEPLGQAIEGDELRGKYAAPIRARRKKKETREEDADYLDEKASKRILEMTRSQQLEIQAEEERESLRRKNPTRDVYDSDEEDEEIEEIQIDEGDV